MTQLNVSVLAQHIRHWSTPNPTSVRATLLDIVAVNMRSSFTEAALCLLNEFSLKL
jgi:hypothetical protein